MDPGAARLRLSLHVLHRALRRAAPERSRKLADVVREAKQVVADGMTRSRAARPDGELVQRRRRTISPICCARSARSTAFGALRFTSPHPNDFSDRVIEAMAEVDAVCEHVHLPMQSGSTRMLKRMLRRYTREEYLECVARLRAAIPGSSLTTDVIVGFPGETDEDFEETLSAVREVGFADAFTFKFSPRDGTPATRMPAELTVPDEVASERLARLVETCAACRARETSRCSASGTRCWSRRRRGAAASCCRRARATSRRCSCPATSSMLGRYLNVELTGTTGSTFTGTIVRERQPLPMAG